MSYNISVAGNKVATFKEFADAYEYFEKVLIPKKVLDIHIYEQRGGSRLFVSRSTNADITDGWQAFDTKTGRYLAVVLPASILSHASQLV